MRRNDVIARSAGAAAVVAASASLAAVYEPSAMGAPVLVGVLGPSLLVGRSRRTSVDIALLIGGFVVSVIALDSFSWSGADRSVWWPFAALAGDGWSTVLSTTLPTISTPATLVVLTALVWSAAGVTATCLARTESVLLPLVGPIGLAVVGALLSERGEIGAVSCAALLATTVVLAFAATARDGVVVRMRSIVVPLVLVAFATPLAIASGAFATDHPAVLRNVLGVAPRSIDLDVDPLALVAAASLPDDERVASGLRFDGRVAAESDGRAPDRLRLRLGALDGFDGSRWTNRGDVVPMGANIPADGGAGAVGRVRLTISRSDLGVIPVPVGARAIDASSRRRLGDVDVNRVDGAVIGPAPSGPIDTTLAIGEAPSPRRLRRLAALLRNDRSDGNGRYRVVSGEADTTSASAADFWAATGDDRTGAALLFAHAFASRASDLGYRSRLAYGFDVAWPSSPVDVSADDLVAWPEVEWQGRWVAFDVVPTDVGDADATEAPADPGDVTGSGPRTEDAGSGPRTETAGGAPAPAPAPPTAPESVPAPADTVSTAAPARTPTTAMSPPPESPTPGGAEDAGGGGGGTRRRPATAIMLVVAVVVAFVLLMGLALRTRRRRPPVESVAAARRRLARLGGLRGRRARHATTDDLVRGVHGRIRADPAAVDLVRATGRRLDRATYGAEPPSWEDAATLSTDCARIARQVRRSRRHTARVNHPRGR